MGTNGPIDNRTEKFCKGCQREVPLYRFRLSGRLWDQNYCMRCHAKRHPLDTRPVSGEEDMDVEGELYVAPDGSPPPKLKRLPLPTLDTTSRCPRCDREWPVNTRCAGYHMAGCGEYVPHYHRRCLTCSQEILEADPTRKATNSKIPLAALFARRAVANSPEIEQIFRSLVRQIVERTSWRK